MTTSVHSTALELREDDRKRDILDKTLILLLALIPIYTGFYAAIGNWVAGSGAVAAWFSCLFIRTLIRRGVGINIIAHLTCLLTFLTINTIVFSMGGSNSPVIVWLILSPLFALSTVQGKSAGAWLIVGSLPVIICYGFGVDGLPPPPMSESIRVAYEAMVVLGMMWVSALLFFLRDRLLYGGLKTDALSTALAQEEKTARERDRAEAALHSRNRFLGAMSHELRTPLNGILGVTELLKTQSLDQETRDLILVIDQSGIALLKVIGLVLDYTASDQRVPAPRATSVAEVLHTAAQSVRPLADNKGLYIEVKTSDALNASISMDRYLLLEALAPLLSNAVRFTDHGSVLLHADVHRDKLNVLIIDTGKGIAADKLQHVFGEFAQEEQGHSRTYDGVGLGLPLSRRLVACLGGTLQVESVVDNGTTFCMTLPLVWVSDMPT